MPKRLFTEAGERQSGLQRPGGTEDGNAGHVGREEEDAESTRTLVILRFSRLELRPFLGVNRSGCVSALLPRSDSPGWKNKRFFNWQFNFPVETESESARCYSCFHEQLWPRVRSQAAALSSRVPEASGVRCLCTRVAALLISACATCFFLNGSAC